MAVGQFAYRAVLLWVFRGSFLDSPFDRRLCIAGADIVVDLIPRKANALAGPRFSQCPGFSDAQKRSHGNSEHAGYFRRCEKLFVFHVVVHQLILLNKNHRKVLFPRLSMDRTNVATEDRPTESTFR